jgi:DNA mismatch endonuclease (patch repair protein)
MACVKSKNNKSTELKFLDALKSCSISGWRRHHDVLGKPDFVFPKQKIAVFIDGCFWHGCTKHCRLPATNVQYWVPKIENNARRDRYVTNELKKRGWTVIRIWEHELMDSSSLSRKLKRLKSNLSMHA